MFFAPRACFAPSLLTRWFVGLGSLAVAASHAAALTLTTIHTFDPLVDGNVPYPALTEGADGKFYGVNSAGGRSSNGTIFSLGPNGGAFTVLNTFTQSNQGTTPQGGLVQARDGEFYGTTETGGGGGYGTFFQVDPSTGKLLILSNFTNGNPGGSPLGTPTEGLDGYLYGTAQYGGTDNYGTVYRVLPPTGTAQTFVTVTGGLAGYYPQSDLVQGYDGNFYGTTIQGGANNLGTFFQVTSAGAYTVLYSFTGNADGSRPLRGVVQGTDGAFYGVCNQGGSYGAGAVYKFVVSGASATVTPLYSFLPYLGDPSNARSSLVQGSDGNFYGTSSAGGTTGNGTIFRVTPTGGFAVLYSFANGTDGTSPIGGLIQGQDGRLYGTTAGLNGSAGTVFNLDLGLPAPAPTPTYLLQGSAAAGDTILIKGNHFVGTSAVAFAGSGGAATVAAASFAVLSNTVLQVVVPSGALSGAVQVTANGFSVSTSASLTVAAAPAPAPTLSTVTVLASAPVASKADGTKGKFKVARADGDDSQALTVGYKIAPTSTATLGTDYTLVANSTTLGASGTITIPAGAASVTVKVKPVRSTAAAPATTVILKLKASAAYTKGSPAKAIVQVTSNTAGQ